MSHHGCPERLSNRSKGFQDDGCSQPTMEVLVETLTGAAFEMTVFPTDTILAIKSKIFRVEGIPVSQQHILYNLRELEDSYSLRDYSITDGAKLKLVLGLRVGPITTRRLLPPQSHDTSWRDIERLFDSNREEEVWEGGSGGGGASGGEGWGVTVVVVRDGDRVEVVRLTDHTPLAAPTHAPTRSPSLKSRIASGLIHENAVTMGKMMDLRRRMETTTRTERPHHSRENNPDVIQKTRSEETLSVPSLLDEEFSTRSYTPYESEDNLTSLYDGNYTRYEYDYSFTDRYTLLPPIGTRAESDHSVQEAVSAEIDRLKMGVSPPLEGACVMSASTPALNAPAPPPHLSRHHNTDSLHLHTCRPRWKPTTCRTPPPPLSSLPAIPPGYTSIPPGYPEVPPGFSPLHRRAIPPLPSAIPPAPPSIPPAPPSMPAVPQRVRCGFCHKRLTIATVHKCRCGATYCAPHRYAEVHGCAYDYKAGAHSIIQRNNPLVSAPKLPKI